MTVVMRVRLARVALGSIVLSLSAIWTPAQVRDAKKCNGPIYNRKEVTQPARVTRGADFAAIYGAFGNDVHARVTLEAVLCRSGQVTDIRIIDSRPANVGEFVAAAVSLIRFTPAELNLHSVSQRQKFEFLINDDSDIKRIDPAAASGRLLE